MAYMVDALGDYMGDYMGVRWVHTWLVYGWSSSAVQSIMDISCLIRLSTTFAAASSNHRPQAS